MYGRTRFEHPLEPVFQELVKALLGGPSGVDFMKPVRPKFTDKT
jgi:hypothetical protein